MLVTREKMFWKPQAQSKKKKLKKRHTELFICFIIFQPQFAVVVFRTFGKGTTQFYVILIKKGLKVQQGNR